MSTTTTNYGLIKPDTTDPILIGQLNDNSDAIDAALKENADAIENKPDAADIPSPSTAAPAMDGTAAAGTSTDYARADHVHPSDTSKQDALTTAQLAAANSGIDSAKVEQIETNKNNISISTIEIADCLTMAEGYTADSLSKIYKQGNHIFGQLIINKNNGNFGGAQETIGRFKPGYRPKDIQIQQCAFSTSAYNAQNIGYSYIQFTSGTSNPGVVIVKGYATDVGSYVNIHIDFVT